MKFPLEKIDYSDLNSRQKEAYNFQKVSGILADYGFSTIRLQDDWQGADFIAQHMDGLQFLKVQLKGRLFVSEKYRGKDVYICFPDREAWYLLPHDEVLDWLLLNRNLGESRSWREGAEYHFPSLPADIRDEIEVYRISGA